MLRWAPPLSRTRRSDGSAGDASGEGAALWRALLEVHQAAPAGLRGQGEGDASPLRSPGAGSGGPGGEEEPSSGPGVSPEGTDKLSHRRAQREKQVR